MVYRVTYPSCHPPKKQSPRPEGSSWTLFFSFTPCLGGGKKDKSPCSIGICESQTYKRAKCCPYARYFVYYCNPMVLAVILYSTLFSKDASTTWSIRWVMNLLGFQILVHPIVIVRTGLYIQTGRGWTEWQNLSYPRPSKFSYITYSVSVNFLGWCKFVGHNIRSCRIFFFSFLHFWIFGTFCVQVPGNAGQK